MAKINDVDKAGKDIKNTFSEIGNLIGELNNSLEKTLLLTKGVSDNLFQSNDLTKEFMESEENLKGLKETLAGLDEDKQKRLAEAMKTGKGLNHELTKELGLQKHIGKLAGTGGKIKLEVLQKLIDKQDELNAKKEEEKKKEEKKAAFEAKVIKSANAAADVFLTAIMKTDEETTKMARSLNMSKDEAIDIKEQFAIIAVNSGDIAINSIRLGKANAGLNAQLGTGVRFSGEMLTTFSKLTEIVGISAEAAAQLAFQAQISGQSFREVEENVLGASYEMQRGVGIQLNMKDILEATGKATGKLMANLGANPEAIAKAVTQAKLLGTELEALHAAGATLLEFESSIEKELEAELLIGKQLNLEKARAAALAGDELALGEELSKNFGTHKEFINMNVIQRQKLAAAVGLEAGAMADMLFKQETMNMNAKQLRAQGKGELADKLEQLDTQEKIALAQEKFQAAIGDLATVFLPIVEGFGNLVSFIAESKGGVIALVSVMAGLAAVSVANAIASIYMSLGAIPFIGIGLAVAATVGFLATMASAKSKVKDGHAPASRGPFTIMDNYGSVQGTTPGDSIDVTGGARNGGASSQPIVIQNKIDPYTMANGGKPRGGFGAIQEHQSSPTMA